MGLFSRLREFFKDLLCISRCCIHEIVVLEKQEKKNKHVKK